MVRTTDSQTRGGRQASTRSGRAALHGQRLDTRTCDGGRLVRNTPSRTQQQYNVGGGEQRERWDPNVHYVKGVDYLMAI